MDNTNLYKAGLMLGGGFLLFWLFKPKGASENMKSAIGATNVSFDSGKPVTAKQKEDASIVLNAYQQAVSANEPPMILSELNRECMKDYGMKCYQKKDGVFCVTDESGREILSA
jgi:hypothetical protein